MVDFAAGGLPLSQAGIDAALGLIGLGAAEMWAVVSVETAGCGYLADRRPQILFERHLFSKLTGGRFDGTDPDISQPTAGGYGPAGAHQYDRLAVAMQLDHGSALQSASWGLGQILGENFRAAGFASVDDMVAAMILSEDNQLRAMMNFLKSTGWDQQLRAHDWAGFARRYNGPNFAANHYDSLLAHFFERYANGPLPDLQVRTAQVYLRYKGQPVGAIDGVNGPGTTRAVKAFQSSIGVDPTGVIDDSLIASLKS